MHHPAALSDTAGTTVPHRWNAQGTTDSVYRAMLRRPGLRLEDLRATLALEDRELHRALDELSDLALVDDSWRETRTVHPASPQLGLQALLARKQAEIARQQQFLEKTREQLGWLVNHHMSQDATAPGTGTERVHGPATVRMRIREMISLTQRELLSFVPQGPAEPLTGTLLARTVQVRTVCSPQALRPPAHVARRPETAQPDGTTETAAHPAQYRTLPDLPIRLHIADRRTALAQMDTDEGWQDALLVEEPAVVAVLVSLFETIWCSAARPQAATSRDEAPGESETLNEQDLQLLRLLSQGLTDEAAARKMGVSLRTERRMLTKLSQSLDAHSRFQLGQRAAERGLL
ncbi:hypothetical protein ACFXDO_18785 [Streptomyces nigra]|uniref:hypothetical protein n=1 Tax=Streptomyces nigra TaxID=1827580 RepID=UPI00368BF56D